MIYNEVMIYWLKQIEDNYNCRNGVIQEKDATHKPTDIEARAITELEESWDCIYIGYADLKHV